jgi:hypothetical protein
MLALVSALVTFNAWPTRDGSASASEVAVQRAPATRLVRAVRRSGPAAGTAAGGRAGSGGASALAGAGGAGASGGAGGSRGAGGPGGPGAGVPGGSGPVPVYPAPQVPQAPPGEGDPSQGTSTPSAVASPVAVVHTTVCGAVSGVGAGGAAGC